MNRTKTGQPIDAVWKTVEGGETYMTKGPGEVPDSEFDRKNR